MLNFISKYLYQGYLTSIGTSQKPMSNAVDLIKKLKIVFNIGFNIKIDTVFTSWMFQISSILSVEGNTFQSKLLKLVALT